MYALRNSIARCSSKYDHLVIHRFPPKEDRFVEKFLEVGQKGGSAVTMESLKKRVTEDLKACKVASAPPEGQTVLPNGRISLKNRYFGRGYLDQNRGPLTGQTGHEQAELFRRTPEPLEGFAISAPEYMAQFMDPKASMKRFYWNAFWGFVIGFGWAILYRINDNAMFAEWDRTYKEHLVIHKKFHAERLDRLAEENIQYDTEPLHKPESFLIKV